MEVVETDNAVVALYFYILNYLHLRVLSCYLEFGGARDTHLHVFNGDVFEDLAVVNIPHSLIIPHF